MLKIMNNSTQSIRGSMPAMVTPLTPHGRVDHDAQRRIIQFFLDSGIHGTVVLGSTGEMQGPDWDQRSAAIATVVEAVNGQVPVIAGAGLPNLKATIDQIKEAAGVGADAALVVPPYYFPIGQDAIVAWFDRLVSESPIPVMYYHFPDMTKLSADPDTVVRLRDVGVAGMKDSGGSTTYLHEVLFRVREDEGFPVMLGSDGHLIDALLNGADGCIGLPQNVVPHLSVDMFNAFRDGDLETAHRLQRTAADFLVKLMLSLPGQAAAKAALEKMGLCTRKMAPPFTELTNEEADSLWERLKSYCRVPTGSV